MDPSRTSDPVNNHQHPLSMEDGSMSSSTASSSYPPSAGGNVVVNMNSFPTGSRDSGIEGIGLADANNHLETRTASTTIPITSPSTATYRVTSPPRYAPRRKNFFQRRCNLCIRGCKWLPVIFILAVLSWGYYAFVIELCLSTLEFVILRVLLLVIFHYLMAMTLWSYYQTIFTPPGSVPREFWLTIQELEAINNEPTEERRRAKYEAIIHSRRLPVYARTYTGGFRTCEKCNLIKPDRSHHCSVCDACILKMDHHCPWVNNCVSFTNYKYFVLFLGYSFTLCLFSAVASFPSFLKFWKNDLGSGSYGSKLHILFLFFVSIMFALSLASLFFYHIFLTLKNRSTLESFRTPVFRYGPDKKAYDLGKSRNWKEIFGDSVFYWFFPTATSPGDGLRYPTSLHNQGMLAGEDADRTLRVVSTSTRERGVIGGDSSGEGGRNMTQHSYGFQSQQSQNFSNCPARQPQFASGFPYSDGKGYQQ